VLVVGVVRVPELAVRAKLELQELVAELALVTLRVSVRRRREKRREAERDRRRRRGRMEDRVRFEVRVACGDVEAGAGTRLGAAGRARAEETRTT
jgi:hypothetical protein